MLQAVEPGARPQKPKAAPVRRERAGAEAAAGAESQSPRPKAKKKPKPKPRKGRGDTIYADDIDSDDDSDDGARVQQLLSAVQARSMVLGRRVPRVQSSQPVTMTVRARPESHGHVHSRRHASRCVHCSG